MLGPTLLRASRNQRLRGVIERNPLTRKVVTRFVAGEDRDAVLAAVHRLHSRGMTTTLDFLGEDVSDLAGARRVRDQYLALLDRLHEAGDAERSEVSVKLSAVGQSIPKDGHGIALGHAHQIAVAAAAAGCRMTLDMEDHTTVDSTLAIGDELRHEFPLTGNVLQANLRRTAGDLARLADSGARVRLVKGAYREPESVAYQRKHEVDAAYRQGLHQLMASGCYPMVATHDPAMIRAASDAAEQHGKGLDEWEIQMLYGISAGLQSQLARSGHTVRIYIPYGTDWYGYFMRRLAERPANVAFFLRALARG
ncbi:proline dehydrogenase family protein [Dactylosporangium sp. NPDC000244]|uniref:proline dehydrogenase family protein n=1 Tax=Dactylosporangium sp. NPDC000244 TaxID=3154365 RepID=UPI00332AAF5C